MKKVLLIMSLMMCALVVFAGSDSDSLTLNLTITGFTKAAWVNTGVNLEQIKDVAAWDQMAGDPNNSPASHDMTFGSNYTVRAVAFTNEKNPITMTVSGGPLKATDTSSTISLEVTGEGMEKKRWEIDSEANSLTWKESPVGSKTRLFEKTVTFAIEKTSYDAALASLEGYSSQVTLIVSTDA